MVVERFVRVRGFHSLQVIIVLILFLGANICYGVSYFDNLEKSRALFKEVSLANQIRLEKVFESKRANGGWAQGFTVTNKYFVIVTTAKNGNNTLTAYDKKTLEKVKSIKCDIGHGNDLTYNENTGEILALGGPDNVIKFFDADTLEEMPKRQLELGVDIMPAGNVNSIAYDSDLDKYYISSAKTDIRIWGGDFIPTNISYEIESPFNLYQTISYHKGNVYYARGCHVMRGICQQEPTGDEEWGEEYAPSTGAVIVYNARTGQKDSVYYIPPVDEYDRYYGEFEGVSIDERNEMYFLYSSYGNDMPSVGEDETFVVFRLAKSDGADGNAKLRKMLNRNSYGYTATPSIKSLWKQ